MSAAEDQRGARAIATTMGLVHGRRGAATSTTVDPCLDRHAPPDQRIDRPPLRRCRRGARVCQPLGGRVVDRYYDPATDQFLSVDPLVSETQEPYGYAGDDPTNMQDPLGLDHVYILSRNGQPYYVGRTSDLARRLTAHEQTDLYCSDTDEYTQLATGDISVEAAAGLEQRTIETFGLDNLENSRNEIAQLSRSRRWTYKSATDEANEVLRSNPDAVDQINGFAEALGQSDINIPSPESFWDSGFDAWWDNGGLGASGDDG